MHEHKRHTLTVQVEKSIIEALDLMAKEMSEEMGVEVHRSALVRKLIRRHLADSGFKDVVPS